MTWKITEAASCSSSLFIPTKYPRWQVWRQNRDGSSLNYIYKSLLCCFWMQKPFRQVLRGPTAGILESSCAQLLTVLNSSDATVNLALKCSVCVALQPGEMSYSRSWDKLNTWFSLQILTPGSWIFPTSCVCQQLYTEVLIRACGRRGLKARGKELPKWYKEALAWREGKEVL